MEHADGPRTPYEVYCNHCQSSFALGTRRCVHCGRPLGGGAFSGARRTPEAPPGVSEEEGLEPGLTRRIAGASLWVMVAIAAVATRLCAER